MAAPPSREGTRVGRQPRGRPAPLRALRCALLLACGAALAHGYPLYYSANGSALLTSSRGGDIVIQPDGGGAWSPARVQRAAALLAAHARPRRVLQGRRCGPAHWCCGTAPSHVR